MGIGPDTLMEINPDLIYVSISGFGPDGPYRDWRVYDPIVQSVSGVVSIQQSPDIPIPDLVRTIVCDKTTALTASNAITAALFARASGSQLVNILKFLCLIQLFIGCGRMCLWATQCSVMM